MIRFALRHSRIERYTLLRGVLDSSSITARFPLSPAHQKQGSFPPPALPDIHGHTTLSDFRTGHHPIDDVGGATSTSTGSPPITQIIFPACRAHYPGGPNRCLSVSSPFARPSPVNRRVGIHNFTFEACSGFTRITACKVAARPTADSCPEASTQPVARPSRSVEPGPFLQAESDVVAQNEMKGRDYELLAQAVFQQLHDQDVVPGVVVEHNVIKQGAKT